jgi:hypothetical protein
MEEGEVADVESVEARGHTMVVLELVEAPLNAVADLVDLSRAG